MKQFGFRAFRDQGYTVPNSNEDLVITKDIKEKDPYGREVPHMVITYKGKFICKFYYYYGMYNVVDADPETAVELGLLARPSKNDMVDSLLDSLYYIYNPIRLTKGKANLIKAATIKALYVRADSNQFMNSTMTKQIIAVFKQAMSEKAIRLGHQPDTLAFYKAIADEMKLYGLLYGRFKICNLSGRYGRARYFYRRILDNETVFIHEDINIEDYQLTAEGQYLLYPDQYIWDDRVYSSQEGTCTCPMCEQEVPTSALLDGEECTRCSKQSYEIYPYSTRVPQLLKFKATKVRPKVEPLYLGCELEFETTDRDTARIKVGKALKGHAIMKSDGSIRNGFEVVTCPATIDIHLQEFAKFYSNLPGELTIASNVGMHVHVSKKPLSVLTIGKLTAFMNRKDNQKFIEYVAGRKNNTYCTQNENRTVTYPFTHEGGGDRYNTLNLNPRDTIEFRIFSTPLKYDEFASKIQFCQALVEYCMPANLGLSLKQLTSYQAFLEWVMPKRKDYPQLVSTLKEFA